MPIIKRTYKVDRMIAFGIQIIEVYSPPTGIRENQHWINELLIMNNVGIIPINADILKQILESPAFLSFRCFSPKYRYFVIYVGAFYNFQQEVNLAIIFSE